MNILERIRSDFAVLAGASATLKAYKELEAEGSRTVADDLERTVDRFPDNIAFRFEGAAITYREFDARANRYAHWALAQGLKPGAVVALFMSNRPDYVACWMGLAKAGVTAALINSNLQGGPLTHSIDISGADHVIVSEDLADALAAVAPNLARKSKAWVQRLPPAAAPNTMENLDAALAALPADRPPTEHRAGIKSKDLALYVYTSGTTGAPKAAKLTHLRTMGMMRAFIGGGKARPSDRVYVTLPLYHGTGGLCGIGFAIESGASVILRRKFSTSHFWEDCVNEGATVFFYIGELCRYLVNAPPHPLERQHKLRLGVGNGMRPEVWEKFKERFGDIKFLEFYGSTEGNVSLLNFDNKVGSIGRIPSWMQSRVNVRILKFDVETEQPVRGPDGFCIEADVDEAGEAVGLIDPDEPRFKYEGYAGDKSQTEKKILRDVFQKGDAWFRTGDLLRKDKDGYFYFIDRIGDTFRWKGENVSTNEVGDVLAQFPGIAEANVYGVSIPGHDGRAGMAALTVSKDIDLAALRAYLVRELPSYARPLFLRLQPEITTTGTFKYRKVDLVRDGFDLARVADPIYFDDPTAQAYVDLTPELAARIVSGEIKL
ncbi:MAG: long-chain-acyl-CoA synthetase [Hydrogenophilaceae bacterium]|jgi:fatty-acyl-CoA synthase|nr:long-chain-acyl-CoA synthetase [Hydrogenophilaceae bacterium]